MLSAVHPIDQHVILKTAEKPVIAQEDFDADVHLLNAAGPFVADLTTGSKRQGQICSLAFKTNTLTHAC